MGKDVMDIFMWIVLGSLAVLVIMNASNFATAVSAVGGFVTSESTILTGSNYGGGGGGQVAGIRRGARVG